MSKIENQKSEGREKTWVALLLERPFAAAFIFLFFVLVCWFFRVEINGIIIKGPSQTVVPKEPETKTEEGKKDIFTIQPRPTNKTKKLNFSIVDSLTGNPIPDVTVLIVSNGKSAKSSKTGEVHLPLEETENNVACMFTHGEYKIYRENFGANPSTFIIKLPRK
jgi:hypothetical protein